MESEMTDEITRLAIPKSARQELRDLAELESRNLQGMFVTILKFYKEQKYGNKTNPVSKT
jgi:hypothetical protein